MWNRKRRNEVLFVRKYISSYFEVWEMWGARKVRCFRVEFLFSIETNIAKSWNENLIGKPGGGSTG